MDGVSGRMRVCLVEAGCLGKKCRVMVEVVGGPREGGRGPLGAPILAGSMGMEGLERRSTKDYK